MRSVQAALRALSLAGGVGAFLARPVVRLRPHTVRSDAPPSVTLDGFRQQLEAGGDLVAGDGDCVVARFAGEAGIFRYRTVELVAFRSDAVTFEHLDGPFRECHERFRVEPAPDGGSVVTHEGTFTMRMGLAGWLLGVVAVRPTFERHVAAHMASLSERSATMGGLGARAVPAPDHASPCSPKAMASASERSAARSRLR
ncbi:MAG TPA: hypothetical protein VE575_05870 [Acidimicrobiales bacterium]|nr:hypothetical protein [Acidimicrobiales bacterium]